MIVQYLAPGVLLGLLAACSREPVPPAPVSRTEAPVSSPQTGAGLENLPVDQRVREALRSNQQVSTLSIEVEPTATGVLLKGRVPTSDQRDWADRVARGVAGTAVVRNELAVGDPAATAAPGK